MRKSWHVVQELAFAPVSVTGIFKRRAHVRTTAALLSSAFLLGISLAQGPPENQPKGQQNGMSTGAAARCREGCSVSTDYSGRVRRRCPSDFYRHHPHAGLDRFHHRSGTTQKGTTSRHPAPGSRSLTMTRMDGSISISSMVNIFGLKRQRALTQSDAPPQ